MTQLCAWTMGKKTLLGAVALTVMGMSASACGGGDGPSGEGTGANNAGGAGANGSGGNGSDGSGGSGIDPNADVGDLRMAACDTDGEYRVQVYETTGWTDQVECEPAFLTKWDTAQPGVSEDNQIQLPLVEVGSYDFWVDWGDGSLDHITKWDAAEATHTYAEAGEYDVKTVGVFEGWQFGKSLYGGGAEYLDAEKILAVLQWGGLAFGAVDGQFAGASSLQITAGDAPDLSKTSSLEAAFYLAKKLNADLSAWDISNVTSLKSIFSYAEQFDGNISSWNTVNVTNLEYAFTGATSFNGAIGGWNTQSLTDLHATFVDAVSFDQDLDNWDTSKVTTLVATFAGASAFNGSLTWDTSAVTLFSSTFEGAAAFNQDIGSWDTSSAVSMSSMFNGATVFNQDISGWDVSKVTNMKGMFQAAKAFNQDIGASWDVSSVFDMTDMFRDASSFDQDLSKWTISKVESMDTMLSFSGLSVSNYGSLLSGWALKSVQANVSLGAHGLQYPNAVTPSRNALTGGSNQWTITGDSCADCP